MGEMRYYQTLNFKVRSEVLNPVVIKNYVVWNLTAIVFLKLTEVSEEHIASIFMRKEYVERTSMQ
jgi:hypothetical protein